MLFLSINFIIKKNAITDDWLKLIRGLLQALIAATVFCQDDFSKIALHTLGVFKTAGWMVVGGAANFFVIIYKV